MSDKNQFPTEVIKLPSKGYFYSDDNPLSSGELEIKYPTAKEEDILTSRNLIQKGVVIDKFIQSVIVSDIDMNSMLMGDKNGVMVASRILAYGTDYDVSVKCPSCATSNDVSINLKDIEAKEIDFEEYEQGQQEFDFTLPISKKNIKVKLLTSGDYDNIQSEIKKMKNVKKNKSSDSNDHEVTTRLKYVITEIDGSQDKQKIRSFVDNELLSRDSFELRKFITKITPDLDMNFDFACDECGHSERLPIRMDVSFFWPDGRV